MKFKISKEDVPFLGLLSLFVVFATYGVFSFSSGIDKYADKIEASVISSDEIMVVVNDGDEKNESVPESEVVFDGLFNDVAVDHQNSTAIAYFKQMGFVGGYDDGSFKPDSYVNRAEILAILAKVLDFDFNGGIYENCFSDVGREWYSTNVCYAKEKNIVSGYANGKYEPFRFVSRSEALGIAFLAFGFQLPDSVSSSPFADVNVKSWEAPIAKFAKDGGIVKGDTFAGSTLMTRASFVQSIYDILVFSGGITY